MEKKRNEKQKRKSSSTSETTRGQQTRNSFQRRCRSIVRKFRSQFSLARGPRERGWQWWIPFPLFPRAITFYNLSNAGDFHVLQRSPPAIGNYVARLTINARLRYAHSAIHVLRHALWSSNRFTIYFVRIFFSFNLALKHWRWKIVDTLGIVATFARQSNWLHFEGFKSPVSRRSFFFFL